MVAKLGIGLALILALPLSVQAQIPEAITYQGRLDQDGQPKAGTVDLHFAPFASPTGGVPLNGTPVILDAVPLVGGVFTVQVNFGINEFFSGTPVFVEVGVREDILGGPADATGFTPLLPRQQLTVVPYALHAETARSVGANSVTSGDIVDGAINSRDADTTSVIDGLQRRVSAECQADRAAIRAINSDGSIRCIYLDAPVANAPVVADAPGDVGEHVSADAGSNFFAAAYYDRGNTRLKFVVCSDASCNSPVVIDDPASRDVGQFASLVLASPGARIAYYDATSGDLKLALCSNSNCTGAITIRTLDSTDDVGRFATMIGSGFDGGNMVIAYYNASNNTYKVARCLDSACTSHQVTTLSEFSGGGVGGSAIAMSDSQGAGPRILLLDGGSQAKLVRCANPLCNARSLGATFSTSARAPLALAMRRIPNSIDDSPLWAAFANSSGDVVLHQCDDDACVVRRQVNGISFNSALDSTLSLSLKPEELPLVVGVNGGSTITAVNFLSRSGLPLSSFASQNFLSATGVARLFASAAHDGRGQVGVFYHDLNDDLILQRCVRSDCSDQ